MIASQQDFAEYVKQTYPDVTDCLHSDRRVFDHCPICRARMGLDVRTKQYIAVTYSTAQIAMCASGPGGHLPKPPPDPAFPAIVTFACPECGSFRRWIIYTVDKRVYKILSIPGEDEIEILPSNPPSLRRAYSEAMRAWGANCPMAAVVMLRRALQVVTRDILKGPPARMLGKELSNLKGKPNALGITLTQDFHDNAYILKETANQAAHPDADPELLEFTEDDARNIHIIFLDIVTELFVMPEAEKRVRAEMIAKRKLKLPTPDTK